MNDRTVTAVALIGITALGAAFCFYQLGDRNLWSDEGYSVALATLDWHTVWQTIWAREGNMWLYYALLRGWMHFGHSESFVRTLSVLPAVATIPMVFLLGRRMFSRAAGLLAALLFAVNTDIVRFAHDARSYTLAVFLITLSSWFLLRYAEVGRWRDWVAYVAAITLAFYAHFYALLVVAAQGLVWLCVETSMVRRIKYAAAVACFGLLATPTWLFLFHVGGRDFAWVPATTPETVYEFFRQVCGNGGVELVVVYLAVCGVGVWSRIRDGAPAAPAARWHTGLLIAWFALPPAAVLLYSVTRHPMFVPRYFVLCVPALALLAGAGLAYLRERGMASFVVPLLALAALGSTGLHSYYERDFDVYREDSAAMTNFVLENAAPRDGIVFYPKSQRFLFDYYAGRRAKPTVVFPGAQPGLNDFMFQRMTADMVPDHLGGPQFCRIWLVMNRNIFVPEGIAPVYIEHIRRDYPTSEPTKFQRYVVLRLSSNTDECGVRAPATP